MNKLVTWLKKPYPFIESWSRHAVHSLIGCIFVFVFLYVFEPFNLNTAPNKWELAKISAYFAGVTLAVMIVSTSIMYGLPTIFNDEKWNIGKEIMGNTFIIVTVGMANMVAAHFLFNQQMTWKAFWIWQEVTFLVGFFLAIFTVAVKQQILLKHYKASAESIAKTIRPDYKPDSTITMITLKGQNKDEVFQLNPSSILYLTTADNYVEVWFENENNTLSKKVLRATLKNMEEQLLSNEIFFRCHRTYIVNTERVITLTGNAQGYKLVLNHPEALSIPVSRRLNKDIKTIFSQ